MGKKHDSEPSEVVKRKQDKVLRPHVEIEDQRLLLPMGLVGFAFGVTIESVKKWGVKPVIKRGTEALFYLPEVVANRLGEDQMNKLNPAQEKARLDQTRRMNAELELEKKRGNLVSLDDVTKSVEQQFIILRQRLLAMPTKLARQMAELDDPKEIQAALHGAIVEAMEDLNAEAAAYTGELESEISGYEDSDGDAEGAAENDVGGVGG